MLPPSLRRDAYYCGIQQAELGRDDLIIIDLSSDNVYAQAHLPGAIHVSPGELVSGIQPATGSLPSNEQLSTLFSRLGLTDDKTVVVYDDEGGGWAGRMIWTLDVIGHSRYSYLDGGIHAWLAAGLTTSSEPGQAQAKIYKVDELQEQPQVDVDYLLTNYEKDNVVIWDARTADEFLGIRNFAQRGGHIPGAANYEWTAAMDRLNNLKLRDQEVIRQELADLGIDADKEVITHCQTHHRSGLTYLLGKILGFPNIRAYAGSWSEWGNRDDTPVEAGE